MSKLSRRERERLHRKNEILDAARDLFAEKGYFLTTLDEIADKAEFGKGTLYSYFQNKEDIFFNLLRSDLERLTQTTLMCTSTSDDFETRFRCMVQETLTFFQTNRSFFRMLLNEQHIIHRDITEDMGRSFNQLFDDYLDEVSHFFQIGIEQKILKPMPVKMMASAFVHILFGVNYYWLKESSNRPLLDDLKAVEDMLLFGIKHPDAVLKPAS